MIQRFRCWLMGSSPLANWITLLLILVLIINGIEWIAERVHP